MARELTTQQEKFAQLIASGKNRSDAYREAYPKSRRWKKEALWANSSALANDARVSVRISELKQAVEEQCLWTREDSVRTLREVAADEASKGSEKVAAVKALNDMHGFDAPKQVNIGGSVLEQLLAQISGRSIGVADD